MIQPLNVRHVCIDLEKITQNTLSFKSIIDLFVEVPFISTSTATTQEIEDSSKQRKTRHFSPNSPELSKNGISSTRIIKY